jgi:hypothetical protein
MIWMKDQQVLGVVDNALAEAIEVSNNMNEGSDGARAIDPCLP